MKTGKRLSDGPRQSFLLRDDFPGQFLQIQIEIPDLMLVFCQIIHIENHGALQIGIVEKYAGIIRHQKIAHHIEVVDIVIARNIENKSFIPGKIKGIGHQIVGAEQNHAFFPQLLLQAVKIQPQVIGISQPRRMAVIPEGGRIEHYLFPLGQSQLPPDPGNILRREPEQEVVAGIALLHDAVFLAEFFQMKGRSQLF